MKQSVPNVKHTFSYTPTRFFKEEAETKVEEAKMKEKQTIIRKRKIIGREKAIDEKRTREV